MFAIWLMVSSALMLMRLTMTQETMKDLVKTLLILACVYAVIVSTQIGLKNAVRGVSLTSQYNSSKC